MEKIFLVMLAGLGGLIIGSFLNVIIYRLPIMLQQNWRKQCHEFLNQPQTENQSTINLALPRSHCPHCKKTIAWYENIPLISFLLLKGKCSHCHKKISWRYPLVEIMSAILTIATLLHFGITWQAVAGVVLTWSLVLLFFIDLEQFILPDQITLGLLWLGLLVNLFNLFTSPISAIIGAASGYLILWLIGWTFKKIRGIEGIGYGDYKLLAALGAWFGWQFLPAIILISSITGIIIGLVLILTRKINRQTPIAFGPFLAIAGWIVLMLC